MTEQEIREFCAKYHIIDFNIREDGTVDANCPVFINDNRITRLPFKFGIIKFGFYCESPGLTTLENFPDHVEGFFEVNRCRITSLKGAPVFVGGNFNVENNCLESLEYLPEHIGGAIHMYNNPIREDQCYYETLLRIVESPEYTEYKTLSDVLDGENLVRLLNYLRTKTIKEIIEYNG